MRQQQLRLEEQVTEKNKVCLSNVNTSAIYMPVLIHTLTYTHYLTHLKIIRVQQLKIVDMRKELVSHCTHKHYISVYCHFSTTNTEKLDYVSTHHVHTIHLCYHSVYLVLTVAKVTQCYGRDRYSKQNFTE